MKTFLSKLAGKTGKSNFHQRATLFFSCQIAGLPNCAENGKILRDSEEDYDFLRRQISFAERNALVVEEVYL